MSGDRIPEDWRERLNRVVQRSLSFHWLRATQALVEQHGERALVVQHVQNAIASGQPLQNFGELEEPEGFQRAVDHAWSERRSLRFGGVYDYVTTIRSIESELLAWICFRSEGFAPLSHDRHGWGDWAFQSDGKPLIVEVKSKASPLEKVELVQQALSVAQLLSDNSDFRRIGWSFLPEDQDALTRLHPRSVDRLLDAILRGVPELWRDNPLAPYESRSWVEADSRIDLDNYEDELKITFFVIEGDEGGQAKLVVCGKREADDFLLRFPAMSADAEWEPEQVSLAKVRNLLSRSLLRRQRGSRTCQISTAPEAALWFVHWQSPWHWHHALRHHPQDQEDLLSRLTERMSRFRPTPAVALWVDASQGNVLLNDPAKDLLGRDSLPAPSPPPSSGRRDH